jgi:uncharacterized protein
METTLFFKTNQGHSYYLDTRLQIIGLCNPIFSKTNPKSKSFDQNKNELNYYNRKKKYLSKFGLFENYERNNFIRINSSNIQKWLANTDQIVFEVTDSCNLKCSYCGYGEFYFNYAPRNNAHISEEKVITILNYLNSLWKSNLFDSSDKPITIGFYGGEPLLNFSLIKKVVEFLKSGVFPNRFIFNMTTNGILLNKHMDFIVKNDFNLLISLDGNYSNNGYRINKNGENSFQFVKNNIDILNSKYPEYFENKVNFNAVLHNKNSVSDIFNYIYNRYNKIPGIAELNNSGIRPERLGEFNKAYRNVNVSLQSAKNASEIIEKMFIRLPVYKKILRLIHFYSGFVYKTYNDLLFRRDHNLKIPTGTCFPFSKKIFITVGGQILPCERIGHSFSLGKVSDETVILDFDEIAEKYNNYFDKLDRQCSRCYKNTSCNQCIFNIDNLDLDPHCLEYLGLKEMVGYLSENFSFLENHPSDYYKMMEEVSME